MPIPHHKLSISLWKRCTNNSQLSKTSDKHPVCPVLILQCESRWRSGREPVRDRKTWRNRVKDLIRTIPVPSGGFPGGLSQLFSEPRLWTLPAPFPLFLFLCGWNQDFWLLFCSNHDQNQVPNRLCQEKKQKKSTTLHIKSLFSHPALDTSPTNSLKHPTSH